MITNARCGLSVIPLRKEPSDRSEMTSQVIFGERMQVLQEMEKWFMVRLTHDAYEGWIDKKQIQLMDVESKETAECITSLFEICTNAYSHRIVLPAGARVCNPDKNGFNLNGEHFLLDNASNLCKRVDDILPIAFEFLGVPYLWGGRTFMGIDCSGFTQTIFNLAGRPIPRDAYQQAERGSPISFVEEAKTGDLAFFDNTEGKITHVGIVIEDEYRAKQIIHASGEVRIDALDHEGIFHRKNKKYSHHLRLIKRIL